MLLGVRLELKLFWRPQACLIVSLSFGLFLSWLFWSPTTLSSDHFLVASSLASRRLWRFHKFDDKLLLICPVLAQIKFRQLWKLIFSIFQDKLLSSKCRHLLSLFRWCVDCTFSTISWSDEQIWLYLAIIMRFCSYLIAPFLFEFLEIKHFCISLSSCRGYQILSILLGALNEWAACALDACWVWILFQGVLLEYWLKFLVCEYLLHWISKFVFWILIVFHCHFLFVCISIWEEILLLLLHRFRWNGSCCRLFATKCNQILIFNFKLKWTHQIKIKCGSIRCFFSSSTLLST